MKNKRMVFLQWFAFAFIPLALFISQGCGKKESGTAAASVKIEHMDKMINFLSFTLSVPPEKILYNEATKEVYVPNSPYREKLSELQKRYDDANEYKINHEKNNQ